MPKTIPFASSQPKTIPFGTAPAAQSVPTPQPKSFSDMIFSSLANGATNVTNFFGGGAVADTFGSEIAKIGATPDAKRYLSDTQPTTLQTAGSGLQLGAGLLPVGRMAEGIGAGAKALGAGVKLAKAAGALGAGAGAGYALDVGSNLQGGATDKPALTPGPGTALGVAIPGAIGAKRAVVGFAQDQAPRIINSLIKPLAKDFAYGKNPGRAIAESGIVANNFDELVSKIRAVRQTTGQAIGALGQSLSTKAELNIRDALSPLTDAMHNAAADNNPTVLRRLQEVKTALTDVLVPHIDEQGAIGIKSTGQRNLDKLTFSGVRDVLGQIGDLTKFTGNPSDDKAVNAALKQVYGNVKQVSLDYAKSVSPEVATQFSKLTEKYADLHSAEIAAKYRDQIAQRANLIGIPGHLAGIGGAILGAVASGGAMVPAILAGTGGAVIDKLASTPGFKTRLAAMLSKKAPEEVQGLYNKIPWLSKILPKGTLTSPGDLFLDSETGQSVTNYAKNIQPGLSMKAINIHPDDDATLTKFIDAIRLKGTSNAPTMTERDWTSAQQLLGKVGNLPSDLNKQAVAAENILNGKTDARALYRTGRDFKK